MDFLYTHYDSLIYLLAACVRGLLGFWFVPKMGWRGKERWGLWLILILSPSPLLFFLLITFLKWPIESALEARKQPKKGQR